MPKKKRNPETVVKLAELIMKTYSLQLVEDVFFISMDGVSGIEEGVHSIFPSIVVQRSIVHLVPNAVRYIPSKDYKAV